MIWTEEVDEGDGRQRGTCCVCDHGEGFVGHRLLIGFLLSLSHGEQRLVDPSAALAAIYVMNKVKSLVVTGM